VLQLHVVVLSFTFKGVEMNFKPVRDRIIIRLVEPETKTKSGIIIPDAAVEKPGQGEVLATGPGRVTEDGTLIPTEVKAGDFVLFGKHAGTAIKVDGEEYHILKEEDVLAIVE
jgi:chaperonin GroES